DREEANGARWPSRSSKPVASRVERDGWVQLPGASANPSLTPANESVSYGWQAMRMLSTVARSAKVDYSPSPNRYASSFGHSSASHRMSRRWRHQPAGSDGSYRDARMMTSTGVPSSARRIAYPARRGWYFDGTTIRVRQPRSMARPRIIAPSAAVLSRRPLPIRKAWRGMP